MHILISGATSFIGIHLINELIKNECEIVCIVRRNSFKKKLIPKHEKISIFELDMLEYGEISNYINKPVDCFVHLAWNGTRGFDRDNEHMQKENYRLSMLAVNEVIKLGCKKIISAGSQAEYGIHNGLMSESTNCNPITWYGKQKLKFYNNIFNICIEKGISFKEPRFFSLYGEDDFEGTMIISILKKMLANEPCKLTAGIQMWDFLHIDDAVKGVSKLIFMNCKDGAYNLGSGYPRVLKEYIDEMKECSNSNSKLLYGKIPYPSTGMVAIQPDITKIYSEIDWKPEISFREGIKKVIQYLKSKM